MPLLLPTLHVCLCSACRPVGSVLASLQASGAALADAVNSNGWKWTFSAAATLYTSSASDYLPRGPDGLRSHLWLAAAVISAHGYKGLLTLEEDAGEAFGRALAGILELAPEVACMPAGPCVLQPSSYALMPQLLR